MELLRRFIRPYWKEALLGSFFKLIESIAELLLPFLMARVIDLGIRGGDRELIVTTVVQMIVISLVGLVAVILCHWLAAAASCKLALDVRGAMIEKVSQFSFRELDQFGTSTLTNRLTNDVNLVRDLTAMIIRMVTRAPFLCIGGVVMAIFVDPQMAIVFVIIVPVFAFVVWLIMKKSVPLFKNVQRRTDKLALILRENLTGVRVIRALARQDTEEKRAQEATEGAADAYIRVTDITGWLNPATLLILNIASMVLVYYGGFRVNLGSMTQGELVAFMEYLVLTTSALLIVANMVTYFTRASAAAVRIIEVLDTQPTILYGEKEVTPGDKAGEIALEFSGVSFGYGKDENTLADISFAIPTGSVFGIIGPTGSGKTTIANLMQRAYDPTAGEILLFGIPLPAWSREAMIDLIGFVPQTSVLFSGTVLENMRRGKGDATEEEVAQALDIAQAGPFVASMNKGLRSAVNQGGKNFSGGQRQRLAIARALVKKSPILILDDSLSALDYKTDMELRQALLAKRKGTTTIIVSQRINSVAGADQILVLEEGRIVGLGTHENLLQSCSVYADIYRTQSALSAEQGVAN